MVAILLSLWLLDPSVWPAFRNEARDGVYHGAIRTEWPAGGLPLQWKIKVGDGYAGVSVAEGKVFTIEQRGKSEAAVAYGLKDGKELWANTWPGEYKAFMMGGNGPRSTPTYAGGKVFVVGALARLRAIDAQSGKTVWERDLLKEYGTDNIQWGTAWSPLVLDGLVIAVTGSDRGAIVGLDAATGKERWKREEGEQFYASPVVADLAGKRQILALSGKRIRGLDPVSGEVWWEHLWKTQYGINVAQPLAAGKDRLLLSAGYGHGSTVIEIANEGGRLAARTVWENKNLKSKFNNPVVKDRHAYGLDEGILSCIDLSTGERKWKSGRYGYGQVTLADGHLIVTSEQGEVALVEATPEGFREKTKFAALNGKTWNTPAIAAGLLIVRNESEMAAYRIGKD